MINNSDSSIYLATSFSEEAEKKLIQELLVMDFFNNTYINRRLATYPMAYEDERDVIILELMEILWNRKKCTETFAIFREFESILEIIGKRGHFIHQFEVFLLGCHIFDKIEKKDTKNILNIIGNKNELLTSWLYTSTAHDFGYPLQEGNKIAAKFSTLYFSLKMKNLSEQYSSISNDCWIREEKELLSVKAFNPNENKHETINIDEYILDGIRTSFSGCANEIFELLINTNNHGFISAKILCRNFIEYLENSKKWNNAEKEFLKRISAAIALHALPQTHISDIKKILFNLNPLAYILILIDNIQDWNRTLRPNSKWPSYTLDDFISSPDSIKLTYILEHEKWTKEMRELVNKTLDEKKELLMNLQLPEPAFNFQISLGYRSNDDLFSYNIQINL